MGSAVAVVGAGTVGFVEIGPRRVLNRVGLLDSPDHHVPESGWPIVERTLESTAMNGDVRWAVASPPGGARGVIVCLHGRHGDRRSTFDNVHIHDVVADLGHDFAVVAVDGGEDSYWHPRLDGTDALTMVTDELLPAIDGELGHGLPRAVLGWSMGGYGALLVAETAPDRFRAAVAASPALWPDFSHSSAGAFDDADDFSRFDVRRNVAALSTLTVRVDCGTDDGFVGEARSFAELLPRPNPGRFTEGFHDDAYWRSVAPAQIATIATALA